MQARVQVRVKNEGPVVGIIGSAQTIEQRFAAQRVGERNMHAVKDVFGALPLMFAGSPALTDIDALLEVADGILLTGGRANVHPSFYGVEPDPAYEPYDIPRDELALALIKACVERGVPLLGLCRGFQEMNVAYGGTLHPEIRDLPGRMNHRMPRLENGEIHPDMEVVYGDRHDVRLTPGGVFAKLYGCDTIRVNSLHGQGILEARRAGGGRGRGGRRHHRGDQHRRRAGLCARRAMARRIQGQPPSDQPHAAAGLRRGGEGAGEERLRRRFFQAVASGKNERVAGELGFEPRQTESESVVLPLHHSPTSLGRPSGPEAPRVRPKRALAGVVGGP